MKFVDETYVNKKNYKPSVNDDNELNSSGWMKLRLTDITSPEEVNQIKSNVKDLETHLKQLETKMSIKAANIQDIMVIIDAISKKDMPDIYSIIESQKDQLLSLKKDHKKIETEKLNKSTQENEIKISITELQKNQKELTEKVSNIKDFSSDVSLLFDQQIKLSTKLSNFCEENKKSGDEIKKDLAHRDVFLCGEIDKLKS